MKLHVGNLPKNMSDAEFKALLTPFGDATSPAVIRDATGASKGFGFVEYPSADEARAAIAGLDGKDINGQVLKVAEARPRNEHGSKSGPRA